MSVLAGAASWASAGATAQVDAATNAIIAQAPVIEARSGGAPRRAWAPKFATNVITLVQQPLNR